MIFSNWERLAQIAILSILTYLSLIILLRFYGKRTLAQMNIFDFIVTVAMGSIAAAVVLNSSISLADGIVALFIFCGMQFIMSWLSVQSKRLQDVIKAKPRLLFYQGEFLSDVMRNERVTQEEVLFGIRKAGIAKMESVAAVVLETNGDLSVISASEDNTLTTLIYVTPDPS